MCWFQRVVRTFSLFHQPVLISVEGIIGAGKATLCESLADELRRLGLVVVVVREPVDQWKKGGLLKDFYNDIPKFAFEFQITAFTTRVNSICHAWDQHGSNVDVYLMERSIYSDTLFVQTLQEDKLMTDRQVRTYFQIWKRYVQDKHLPRPITGFIFLDADPNTAQERVKARNVKEEQNKVSLEYQTRLRNHHIYRLLGTKTQAWKEAAGSGIKPTKHTIFPTKASIVHVTPDMAQLDFRTLSGTGPLIPLAEALCIRLIGFVLTGCTTANQWANLAQLSCGVVTLLLGYFA